jgi:SNF2 family DNA or RNA helicase
MIPYLQELSSPHVLKRNFDNEIEFDSQMDIELFNYQKENLMWMKKIENDAIKKAGIKYACNLEYPLFSKNNTYLVCNDKLYSDSCTSFRTTINKTYHFNGGVLMDEMGLGKTITCLAFILSQKFLLPASERTVITDNCNYKYKKGAKAKTFCDKNAIDNSLLCKVHKNAMLDIARCDVNEEHKVSFMSNLNPRNIISKATMIICPSQLCEQWVQECVQKCFGKVKFVMIATIDQFMNATLLELVDADIVIVSSRFFVNSSYEKYCSNFSLQPKHNLLESNVPLHLVHWNRIMLDEAHETFSDKAILRKLSKLESTFRWVITGTPFPLGIHSLLNNLNFISNNFSNPIIDYDTFNTFGFESADFLNKIGRLFRRNTKENVTCEVEKNCITQRVHWLDFTSAERNIYDGHSQGYQNESVSKFLLQLCCDPELYDETKALIKNCKTLDEIQHTILQHNNEKLLLQYREFDILKDELYCCEAEVAIDKENEKEIKMRIGVIKRHLEKVRKTIDSLKRTCTYLRKAISDVKTTTTCPICLDIIAETDLALTSCGHKFCWECIKHTFEVNVVDSNASKCPTCCTQLMIKDVFVISDETLAEDELSKIVQDTKSTKVGNIIYNIKNGMEPGDKCIIFSQWDEILTKVGKKIQTYGIPIVNCTGTIFQRRKAIDQFKKDSKVNILCLSSKYCASGLNLTCANKIVFIEPIYGDKKFQEDVENQAIGRADRIGQRKSIEVSRFLIKDTIEEDIYENRVSTYII